GRIEALAQQDITPIPVDEGVRIFLELIRQALRREESGQLRKWAGEKASPAHFPTFPPARANGTGCAVVVAGHFGEPATLKLAGTELPLRRFLDRKRVHYPGVELIVEAELSAATDPYLDEHALHKQKLLPAVMGLEAMAQAATALTGSTLPPR